MNVVFDYHCAFKPNQATLQPSQVVVHNFQHTPPPPVLFIFGAWVQNTDIHQQPAQTSSFINFINVQPAQCTLQHMATTSFMINLFVKCDVVLRVHLLPFVSVTWRHPNLRVSLFLIAATSMIEVFVVWSVLLVHRCSQTAHVSNASKAQLMPAVVLYNTHSKLTRTPSNVWRYAHSRAETVPRQHHHHNYFTADT
eukprot:m.348619 g.348619  ORF g.348619 m.348619 type:complete len:196 (+) comp16147_c1_seq3:866-1453(+)